MYSLPLCSPAKLTGQTGIEADDPRETGPMTYGSVKGRMDSKIMSSSVFPVGALSMTVPKEAAIIQREAVSTQRGKAGSSVRRKRVLVEVVTVATSSVDWRVIVDVSVGTPGVGRRTPPLRLGLTIAESNWRDRRCSFARAVNIMDGN